jgi:hypothetical protein
MLAWKLSMKAARLVSPMPSGAGHQTGIGPCAIMTQISGNAHKYHASLIHDMRHAPCMACGLCSTMDFTACISLGLIQSQLLLHGIHTELQA